MVGLHLCPEWTVYRPVASGEKSLVVTLWLSLSNVGPLLQTHWGKGVLPGLLPAFCPFWSNEWVSTEKSLQVGMNSSCVCSSQGSCTLRLVNSCPFTVCYNFWLNSFYFSLVLYGTQCLFFLYSTTSKPLLSVISSWRGCLSTHSLWAFWFCMTLVFWWIQEKWWFC